MGSVNKPKADIITITRDLIYKRSEGPNKDTYRYTIIDSPMGSMSGGYLMKKSIVDAGLGSESLFRNGEGIYLLVIGKSGENEMMLSCYGLSESEPVKLWDTAFTAPVIAVDYDEQNGKIAVLCEGKAQKTYMLFSVDAGSGTTSQAYTGSFVDQNAQLRLTTLAGTALVFSSKGEDRPSPTLLYAASLSDIAKSLLPITSAP
jgi:hypothetical protein